MKNTLNKIYKYKMQMKQLNAPRKKLVITRFSFFFRIWLTKVNFVLSLSFYKIRNHKRNDKKNIL